MSPTMQQIAIARVCGWTHTKTVHNPDETAYGRHPVHTADVTWDLPLPDYLNDRNAMHEALMTLTARQGNDLCGYLNMMGIAGEWDLITAPLELLAEAFLRTIDKWEETE
jgi:hypothetical protein